MAQHKLSARGVKTRKKPGHHSDGGNLYLQVSQGGSKSWVFRFRYGEPVERKDGTRKAPTREMGLGPLALVSLEAAREKALACRRLLLDGIDPIQARKDKRAQVLLDDAKKITFGQCADSYIKAHEAGWKNKQHRYQWRQTMDIACETLGTLPVASVDTGLVIKVLEPLWSTKTETASRLRGRIESVLDWAKARGFRAGDNPARWKGHLANLLPKTRKLRRVKHHLALPYAEVPAFMVELRSDPTISARALEFTILTACRTSEGLGASWIEIDLKAKAWTIPAERIKMEKEHRVPLCDRALAILSSLPREDGNPFVFIGGETGEPLGNTAMLNLLRLVRPAPAKTRGLTVHGFRSSFRDWAAEQTNFPREIAEKALAHTVGDETERAYQRGDLFEKRRRLMAEWSRYCERKPVARDRPTVVVMRR